MSLKEIFDAIGSLTKELLDQLPIDVELDHCALTIVEKTPRGRYKCTAEKDGVKTEFLADWVSSEVNGLDTGELIKNGYANDV